MYLHEFFWTSSSTPSCLMLVPQEAKCLNLILCQKLYNINYYIKQFIFFPTECEQELEWLKEAGFDTIVKKYKGKNLIICTCRIQHFGVLHSYISWIVIKPPTVNYLSAMATICFTPADTSSLMFKRLTTAFFLLYSGTVTYMYLCPLDGHLIVVRFNGNIINEQPKGTEPICCML